MLLEKLRFKLPFIRSTCLHRVARKVMYLMDMQLSHTGQAFWAEQSVDPPTSLLPCLLPGCMSHALHHPNTTQSLPQKLCSPPGSLFSPRNLLVPGSPQPTCQPYSWQGSHWGHSTGGLGGLEQQMIPFVAWAKNSTWRMKKKWKVGLLHTSSLNVLSNALFLSSKLRLCILVCRLALEKSWPKLFLINCQQKRDKTFLNTLLLLQLLLEW